MFDIFYLGKKPNLFAHERAVESIEQAQQLSRTRYFWIVNYLSDYSGWDWLWEPVPWQAHQRHAWPSQHQVDSGTYLVPKSGYTETNYHNDRIIVRLSSFDNWIVSKNIDIDSFDFSWHPDYREPDYEYHFATQWQSAGGPTYQGSSGIKLVGIQSKAMPAYDNWLIPDDVDKESVDFSWHPNPLDPPYRYEFGTQWWNEGGPVYTVPGAIDTKYLTDLRIRLISQQKNWHALYDINKDKFDWSWQPHPKDPPYIYVFGNQWYPAKIMPTIEYRVPGAVDVKYVDELHAELTERHDNHWHTLEDCEWDYSWRPEPGSPPLIFVFGNQHWPAVKMPTVEYHMTGATERKYMDYPVAKLLPTDDYWTVPEEVNKSNIDFSWVPDPGSPPYIYHFGTEYQESVGLTYAVPGATELKFAGDIPRLEKDQSAVAVLDIFFLDYSNPMSTVRFEKLKEHYPNIQRVRFVNSLLDTIKRCAAKSTTTRFWVISSRNDYSEFDFGWHAEPWQNSMTHVFGSQWNKWSDTFLINRWELDRHSRWAAGIEQFPNLNFVTDQTVTAPADACDIYVIDHGNRENLQVIEHLTQRYRVVKRARYFDNYLDTLKRLLQDIDTDHIWVVSSICDYTNFDFSWQPEAWQQNMLHVFPSQEQKFGDTFYVPVAALKSKICELELLDWFETVNYCKDQTVTRWPMPTFVHTEDSHVEVVRQADFKEPFALFSNRPINNRDIPTVSVWREKTKTIVPLDAGGAAVIVPRTAIGSIQTQLYDYPHIDKTQRRLQDQPLDIVFISNGETGAEENWQHLLLSTRELKNRIVRSDGVNGRGAAYRAAAEASNTTWFFAVFAKLEVTADFDWSWQPDHLQQAKHYIFNATNPVNGLEYGHQGLIAYNKQLVLATQDILGLDFTLSQPHGVEPVNSGIAKFNTDVWSTWRTAFREVVKLKYYVEQSADVETAYRLKQWQTKATGDYAEWCLKGASDAVEYYESVSGNYDQLLLTFEWAWLRSYFDKKYQA